MFGASGPQRQLATLSLFGDRIPERSQGLILEKMLYVIEMMDWVLLREGSAELPEFRDPHAICSSTVAGMYLLRDQVRENLDRQADTVTRETLLVQFMERFISDFATRLDQGEIPGRFEQYQLLMTYPLLVGDNKDIATEQNLELIQRTMAIEMPAVAELLFRVRDSSLRTPQLAPLIESFPAESEAVFDLSLITSLMLTVCESEHTYNIGTKVPISPQKVRRELDLLEQLPIAPMVYPFFSECARIFEKRG